MNFEIRPGSTCDAPACAAIYRPFVTDTWISFELKPPESAEMATRIADASATHAWLVAQREGDVCAYAYGSPHRARAAYASSADVTVYVRPDCARLGLGRRLYDELFVRLKSRGIHAVFAGIALPNAASVGLHEAAGFLPVGIYRDVGFKMGAFRDVGWWQRLL